MNPISTSDSQWIDVIYYMAVCMYARQHTDT